MVMPLAQEKTDKSRISLKVADIMVKDVIMIDENASVKKAANIMNQHEIGSIIAKKNGKAVGIITERDLLKRIIAEGKDAKRVKVKDAMSTPLTAVIPSMDLEEAARLMFEKKIKKLPVIDQNKIVGLLSLTDIARCQPRIVKLLQVLMATRETPKSIKKVLDNYIV